MSNTYSSDLVTATLAETAMTVLQDQLCPLSAFSRDFGTDPLKPRATVQVKLVTAGSATQTNPTNFEQGDSTVDAVPVAVDQISQCFQVSNEDLNSGLRLADLVTVNAKVFASTLLDLAFAPITEANFGAAVLTSAAPAFGWSDMPTLWAALKKSDAKHCILESEFYARLLTQPGYFQALGEGSSGARVFGWDGLFHTSRFNGAGANVKGFACNPSAIAVASGLPAVCNKIKIPGNSLDIQTVKVPGIDLAVAYCVWFSNATRSLWASFDVCFGASKGDTTALKIVKGT